jgi:hypothetical protein
MPEDTVPEEITPNESIPEATKAFEWPVTPEPVSAPELMPSSEPTFVAPTSNTPTALAEPPLGALIPDPPTPPKKPNKNKALIIGVIIIGSLALLSGGTVAAYNVWYQNPDKVVLEAASSMFQQTTSTHKVSVELKSKSVSAKLTIDAKLAQIPASEADMNAMITYMGKDYTVKASTLTDKDGTLFVKINDLKKLVTTVAGTGADVSAFDSVIKKIDGQWIKISSDDTKTVSAESSKAQVCATNALTSLNDKAVVKEITDVYMANRFIVVGEKIGVKTISGVDSLGYKVTFDEAKAKTFYTALGTTSVGRKLTACDKQFDFKTSSATINNTSSKTTTETQVWSSRFGHHLEEVDVATKDTDGTTTSIVWNPTFATGVTVTTPTTSVPVSELVKDVQKAYSTVGSSKYSSINSSKPSASSMQFTNVRSTSQKLSQILSK